MKILVGALVVLVLGVVGGYFARPALEPMVGGPREIDGEVIAERSEESRLVLTLRVGDETMLATFRNRADDIAELVAPGDAITLRVRGAGVFADDVPIVRVSHAAEAAEPEDAALVVEQEPDTEPEEAHHVVHDEAHDETIAEVEPAPDEGTSGHAVAAPEPRPDHDHAPHG